MTIIIHHHHYHDKDDADRLCRIETALGSIIEKLETLQMSFEEDAVATKEALAAADAALDAANGKLDGIKADVENLMAKIAALPVGGMTPEQEAAVKEIRDAATAIAAKAGGLADKAGVVDDMNP